MLLHISIHVICLSSHTCCVTIICVSESVPNYYSKEIIHPLYVLDNLTNTHSINLKGQFFGCLDELMLVWCHHQLLFSTHACHTRIKIHAYRTRTLFILLLYGFYLYIWRHTSWIWTPEKLLDTKYIFYTNRINNFLRHKQILSRHSHQIVIRYFEFQLLIFLWKLQVSIYYEILILWILKSNFRSY